MENINKKLVEKYLRGTASRKEAEKVLAFFQTDEGRAFLEKTYDSEVHNPEKRYRFATELPDSARTLNKIKQSISGQGITYRSHLNKKPRSQYSVWAVAASIALLVATLSILNIYYDFSNPSEEVVTFVIHTTGEDGQKVLTLSDGSKIRLNADSRFEMPEYFKEKARRVKLEGEAYFEIEHDPDRPFIVETEGTEIQVLGTSFNVKTNTGSNKIYVAVAEGKVSVGTSPHSAELKGILTKNMIGIYNKNTYRFTSENTDVNNFLSWIHGRIIFDETPFSQVIRQLEYKYEINNEVQDKELLDLRLTADFSESSMQNVLEVIGNSLELKYELNDDSIIWRK
ncbi:MAG: FecR domain-containing protein [Balneolaceae bacterium]